MARTDRPVPMSLAVWEMFFDLLARGNTATCAARTLGVSLRGAQRARDTNAEIAARWAEAVDAGGEALEQEAFRRAVEGVERGVYYQGERYASEREYSDGLLMFLLKARMPEKYRERYEIRHEAGDSIVQRLQAGRQRAAGITLEGEAVRVDDAPELPQGIAFDDPIFT